jgi:histidine triad (HIT) family protein
MSDPDCLFCKIVAKAIPAKIVLENDHVLAFEDIRPMAPTHALVIPKKHIVGIHDATPEDAAVLGQVLLAARDAAEKLGLGKAGYRLVVNQGDDAGQSVLHLHCHVLGGRPMAWPPG